MTIDLERVLRGIIEALESDEQCSHVEGTLTGARRADRPQLRVSFVFHGEERAFLCHIQREGPAHTIVRQLVQDTIRSLPRRVIAPIDGLVQPNTVYYPSALGHTPTRIPGQPSEAGTL